MYDIGQYRFNSNFNYYNQENITLDYLQTDSAALEDDIKFINICANLDSSIGEDLSCFYLRFWVKQRQDSQQTFYLKLRNSNLSSDNAYAEQLIEQYKVGQGQAYVPFEVIISPNSVYNQIVWELKRTVVDYQTSVASEGGRVMEILDGKDAKTNESYLYFAKLTDIFKNIFGTDSKVKGFSKIGIQGPPLMLMCINRQQIRIGYNGIYEINNGMKITSISFVPQTINDYFIMDYEYQREEES